MKYPKNTKGTKLARKVRSVSNKLTRKQRDELISKGMDLIYKNHERRPRNLFRGMN